MYFKSKGYLTWVCGWYLKFATKNADLTNYNIHKDFFWEDHVCCDPWNMEKTRHVNLKFSLHSPTRNGGETKMTLSPLTNSIGMFLFVVWKEMKIIIFITKKKIYIYIYNNYSSSPNELWVNNPWDQRPNGLLTQRLWGR